MSGIAPHSSTTAWNKNRPRAQNRRARNTRRREKRRTPLDDVQPAAARGRVQRGEARPRRRVVRELERLHVIRAHGLPELRLHAPQVARRRGRVQRLELCWRRVALRRDWGLCDRRSRHEGFGRRCSGARRSALDKRSLFWQGGRCGFRFGLGFGRGRKLGRRRRRWGNGCSGVDKLLFVRVVVHGGRGGVGGRHSAVNSVTHEVNVTEGSSETSLHDATDSSMVDRKCVGWSRSLLIARRQKVGGGRARQRPRCAWLGKMFGVSTERRHVLVYAATSLAASSRATTSLVPAAWR